MEKWKSAKEHFHYALYSLIILIVVILHADRPISSTSSKLTIVLMALMIFGEAVIRMLQRWRRSIRTGCANKADRGSTV